MKRASLTHLNETILSRTTVFTKDSQPSHPMTLKKSMIGKAESRVEGLGAYVMCSAFSVVR